MRYPLAWENEDHVSRITVKLDRELYKKAVAEFSNDDNSALALRGVRRLGAEQEN